MVFPLSPNTTLSDFRRSKEKKESKVGERNEMFQQQLLASVCLLSLGDLWHSLWDPLPFTPQFISLDPARPTWGRQGPCFKAWRFHHLSICTWSVGLPQSEPQHSLAWTSHLHGSHCEQLAYLRSIWLSQWLSRSRESSLSHSLSIPTVSTRSMKWHLTQAFLFQAHLVWASQQLSVEGSEAACPLLLVKR